MENLKVEGIEFELQGKKIIIVECSVRDGREQKKLLKLKYDDKITCYDIRHKSDDICTPCSLENDVFVNHFGYAVCIGELDISEEGIELEDNEEKELYLTDKYEFDIIDMIDKMIKK